MTSVASELALSDIKTKTTSKFRDYICLLSLNKLDYDEVDRFFIYYKHCPSTLYGFIVVINFYRHLKKYGIFVEIYQNTILAITSDEFVQLYNKLLIID